MGHLEKRTFLEGTKIFIDRYLTDDKTRLWTLIDADRDYRAMTYTWSEKETENILNALPPINDEEVESKIFNYIISKGIETEKVYSAVGDLADGSDKNQIIRHNRYLREHTEDPHFHLSYFFDAFLGTIEEGHKELFFELLMNSVEDFQLGFGNIITIKKVGPCYEVYDNASGIPVEYSDKYGDREWKRLLIDRTITHQYAKEFAEDYNTNFFNEYEKAETYKRCPPYSYKHSSPKGSFLPGGSLLFAKALSKYILIETVRNDKLYRFEFRDGYMIGEKTITDANGRVGTYICWQPSNDIFPNTEISHEEFLEMAETQAVLNPGLKITVDYDGETNEFLYKEGIKGYLAEHIPECDRPNIRYRKIELCSHYDKVCNHECVEMVIVLSNDPRKEYFHNGKRRIFAAFGKTDEYLAEFIEKYSFSFYYNNKEALSEFTVENLSKRIALVVSTNSEYSHYTNETYKGIDDILLNAAFKKLFLNELYFLYKESMEREKKKDE